MASVTISSDLESVLHERDKDCTCAKCRNFCNRVLPKRETQDVSSEKAATRSSHGKLNGLVRKGDRVLVNGSALERKGDSNYPGTVQYVGFTKDNLISPIMRVGVCLDDNVYSSHNGVYQGKRYFFCPRGHGAMVKSSDIKPLSPVLRTWPLSGNPMFPSYEGVKKRRKLREQKIKEAEGILHKEHETRRIAQMTRFSRSATQISFSNKDYLTGGSPQHVHGMDDETFEEFQLQKLKKAFGGDEKADRMIQTLRKLRRAFQEGLAITSGEKE